MKHLFSYNESMISSTLNKESVQRKYCNEIRVLGDQSLDYLKDEGFSFTVIPSFDIIDELNIELIISHA